MADTGLMRLGSSASNMRVVREGALWVLLVQCADGTLEALPLPKRLTPRSLDDLLARMFMAANYRREGRLAATEAIPLTSGTTPL